MDLLTHLEKEIQEIEQMLAQMEYDAKPDAVVIKFICKEDRELMAMFEQELESK